MIHSCGVTPKTVYDSTFEVRAIVDVIKTTVPTPHTACQQEYEKRPKQDKHSWENKKEESKREGLLQLPLFFSTK